ncbi:MAG TPA: hypothetical protein VN709_11920 [Terriglobales bacterium]|nr:hypothetical protein [Terriglobales bacterium]
MDSVSDYIDGDLNLDVAEAARLHAAECSHCHIVLTTTRQTLLLIGSPDMFAPPEGAQARLRQALEAGLGEPLIPEQLRPARVAVQSTPPPPRRWFSIPFLPGRASALSVALVLLVLGAGIIRWRASASTMSGWLCDRHCFTAFQGKYGEHPRDCLMKCADTGYGLVDAKGHFTPLDAKSNATVLAALKQSRKPDHIWVTVHAKMTSQNSLAVQELELTDPTPAAAATSR